MPPKSHSLQVFPKSSPSQRRLVLEASLAPTSIPYFQRRLQGQGYIWTSLPRAGGAGSDLGLCAAAFITLGFVYLPGAACSQILEGPGSVTAWILGVLSFSHQNWGCWCQCNVGTLIFSIIYPLPPVMELPPRNLGSHSLRTGASHGCIGFLKNRHDTPPPTVVSIWKGVVSSLGDPKPWAGFCGEKPMLDWEFWRQQHPLLHGINHLPASDLRFIPCPEMRARGRGE